VSANMNRIVENSSIFTRATVYTLIMLSVYLCFSLLLNADGGASEGFDYASFRGNVIFWVFTSVTFFVMTFCREKATRVSAVFIMFLSILESCAYFGLHAMFYGNIYLGLLVNPIVCFTTYLLAKNRDMILMNACMLLGRFPSGTVRRFSLSMMVTIKPNYISMLSIVTTKYFLRVAVAFWAIHMAYCFAMGIPSDGSIYQTVLANGHFDFIYVSYAMDDLIGLYMMAAVVLTFFKEHEHKATGDRIY